MREIGDGKTPQDKQNWEDSPSAYMQTLFSKKTHANQRSFLDDSMATSNHKPNVWAKDGKRSGRSGASSQVCPSSIRWF